MSISILGIVFLMSVGGMFAVPLRHLKKVRGVDSDQIAENNEANFVRTYVVQWIDLAEAWYRGKAKETFLKLLDVALRFFERGAGRVAGETKHVRIMIQERFRVIPRESLYWKQIHTWKKTNGNGNGNGNSNTHVFQRDAEGSDIANHIR